MLSRIGLHKPHGKKLLDMLPLQVFFWLPLPLAGGLKKGFPQTG